MNTYYRFIGRRGNSTIPYALRVGLGIHPDDLVSYTRDGDRIIIKKEHVCDNCDGMAGKDDYLDTKELKELLSTLPHEAKQEALFYLYTALLKKPKVVPRA